MGEVLRPARRRALHSLRDVRPCRDSPSAHCPGDAVFRQSGGRPAGLGCGCGGKLRPAAARASAVRRPESGRVGGASRAQRPGGQRHGTRPDDAPVPAFGPAARRRSGAVRRRCRTAGGGHGRAGARHATRAGIGSAAVAGAGPGLRRAGDRTAAARRSAGGRGDRRRRRRGERHRGRRQDRAGPALGARGARPVPGRPALRELARLRPHRAAGRSGRRHPRHPGRLRRTGR